MGNPGRLGRRSRNAAAAAARRLGVVLLVFGTRGHGDLLVAGPLRLIAHAENPVPGGPAGRGHPGGHPAPAGPGPRLLRPRRTPRSPVAARPAGKPAPSIGDSGTGERQALGTSRTAARTAG